MNFFRIINISFRDLLLYRIETKFLEAFYEVATCKILKPLMIYTSLRLNINFRLLAFHLIIWEIKSS